MHEEKMRLLQSISTLSAELEAVRVELTSATKQRLYAEEVEKQLDAEVDSLSKLIDVRKKRLAPYLTDDPTEQPKLDLAAVDDDPEVTQNSEPGDAVNRVSWILNFVEQSGSVGMIPPDASRAAAEAGIRMHSNYPYTALKVLLKRDKIIKRKGRYYKKSD